VWCEKQENRRCCHSGLFLQLLNPVAGKRCIVPDGCFSASSKVPQNLPPGHFWLWTDHFLEGVGVRCRAGVSAPMAGALKTAICCSTKNRPGPRTVPITGVRCSTTWSADGWSLATSAIPSDCPPSEEARGLAPKEPLPRRSSHSPRTTCPMPWPAGKERTSSGGANGAHGARASAVPRRKSWPRAIDLQPSTRYKS